MHYKKIMEINPNHPIIKALCERIKNDKENKSNNISPRK